MVGLDVKLFGDKFNKIISLGANIAYTNGFSSAPVTGSSFATAGAARLAFVLPPIIGPYLNDGTYNINGSQVGSMGTGLPALGYYNPTAILDLNSFTSDSFFKVYQGSWVTALMGGGGIGENYFFMEFLGEGIRNMDLMRLNLTIPGKDGGSMGNIAAIPPSSPSYIWPIPATEITFNSLMTPNE